MFIYVSVLMTMIVSLFIVIGFLLKTGKHNWIILGYKSSAEMEREGVDIAGLGNFIGSSCFAIAALLLLAGVLDHYHQFHGVVFSIASLFFVVAFILIRIQKYRRRILPNMASPPRAKVALGIIVSVLLLAGSMLVYGGIEESVQVAKDEIEIGGLYGTTLEMSHVSDVSLLARLPKIQTKIGGFDFAAAIKGRFKLEGIGDGRLYVNAIAPPFIEIKYNDTFVILNFKDSTTTLATFEKISKFRKIE